MSNLSPSAGKRFRTALANEKPLQIVGTINAYMALMAERSGFQPSISPAPGWRTPPMACRISA